MVARLRTRAVGVLDPGRLMRPVGMLIALVGVAVLLTALRIAVGRGEPNFGLLVGAAGMAVFIAGAFMAGRRRPDLVAALLGSMTAASFAVALAAGQLSAAERERRAAVRVLPADAPVRGRVLPLPGTAGRLPIGRGDFVNSRFPTRPGWQPEGLML